MDQLLNILTQLGLGVATNAIYDFLKKTLAEKQINSQQIVNEIQNQIKMHGVSVQADTVINALVQNGFLEINQSHLHANQRLIFGSSQGKAIFGNNSTMTTNKTGILAGAGAFIETNGNAQVRHNPDGSISFHVGE
jgi:hypothetical protein